jgi:hypothetical protein
MEKKFLDKVVDQIISETRMDYENERVYTPFSSPISSYSRLIYRLTIYPYTKVYFSLKHIISSIPPFPHHCKEVYGLNDEEIEYVWGKYIKELLYINIYNG